MCGQLGCLFGKKDRSQTKINHITELFTDLLMASEARGRHASGLAWLKTNGDGKVLKLPVPASVLADSPKYRGMLSEVDGTTTILMGHTRWKTRGDEQNNANNHPIVTRLCCGTHYGESVLMLSRRAIHARVDANRPVNEHIILRRCTHIHAQFQDRVKAISLYCTMPSGEIISHEHP